MRVFCLAGAVATFPLSVQGQDNAEVALIKQVFAKIQPVSIAENTEYCGYVGLDENGTLTASPATRGDEASCLADDPAMIAVVTASYHTHGAYLPDYDNEVPSTADVEGDIDEGIDGYVATPGGRLWYIDTVDETLSQLCGIGCLFADPAFVPDSAGRIAQSYTLDQLVDLLE